jgi:putative hydrolase of the HAD superfamily
MAGELSTMVTVRNIVFDLGGVLYAIDPQRTAVGLHALAGPGARPMAMDDPLFLDFEMGRIDPADFRAQLRIAVDSQASDAALDAAWNALLLGPIPGRLEAIAALSRSYNIVLLSNTNVIHQEIWGPECAEMFAFLQRTFFSFEMGKRKPDASIYLDVLDQMGFAASETLLVDDSPANISGAEAIGMQGLLMDPHSANQFSHFCLKFLNKV